MAISEAFKRIVRRSPLAPLARAVHRRVWPLPVPQNDRYDEQTREVIRRVLRPDSSAVDVGAHAGLMLGPICEAAPRGRHFAFEALDDLAGRLRERFPTVEVVAAAAAAVVGTATFTRCVTDLQYSGLRRREYDHASPELVEVTVSVTTVDAVVPPDVRVAFIKIDVEGGEGEVLRGARETIRRGRPVVVFEASARSTGKYGWTPEAFYDLLASYGYAVSLMARWLAGQPALTREAFADNWNGRAPAGQEPEFYFIAYPADEGGVRPTPAARRGILD